MTTPQKTIVGTAIFLLALGAGIWGWKKGLFSKETTPTPPVVTEDPYAGWQTYRNEEYGFEVRYPEEWIADVQGADDGDSYSPKELAEDPRRSMVVSFGTLASKPGGYIVSVYFRSVANTSVEKIIADNYSWENRTDEEFSGARAVKLCWKSGCRHGASGLDVRYIFEKGGLVWEISGGVTDGKGSPEDVIVVEKAIQSFRFTNGASLRNQK